MKKSNIFMYIIIILFTLVSIIRLVDLNVFKKEKYRGEYDEIVNRTFTGSSAPRGRILDVNGKVLVDNIGVNTVIYNRRSGVSTSDEIDIALNLSSVLEIDENKITSDKLKKFYLVTHDNGKNLITSEEYKLYEERKLNSSDIEALKYSRVTDDMLNSMTPMERNASYIYYLLSNGYSYQDKIIKKDITDEELAKINELNLCGVRVELTWERTYPYGEVLRSIFGTVSTNGIPSELKDYYVSKGLKLDSTVGVSYLEYEYDDYLRGKDAVYRVNQDNTIELLEGEEQGNDLYLSIDIDVQLEVESILKEEMLNAKKAKNTEYYNHSYVIVGHPLTGEIVAMSGLQINEDHFVDITSNIISSSYTVGSVVKGASISVGYQQNLIEEDAYVTDSCIKVYGVTEKCSWKSLGKITDLTALAYSSNYYQFLIATRLTNPNYKWNSKLNATSEHFAIYRNMYSSFGLGNITGIDLPNEKTGIIGKTVSDDLLLNLTIGQYDTYTPIELFQYINTIANNGVRLAPSLMKKITNGDETVKENTSKELNRVDLGEQYIKRVQEGFREVMTIGTGRNYAGGIVTAAGKTGTSETFVDTNADGVMDTKTISTAFVMYAPFENPEYSIVILSPNISVEREETSYKYSINLRVNKKIVKYLFENRE